VRRSLVLKPRYDRNEEGVLGLWLLDGEFVASLLDPMIGPRWLANG
jgi:hypothetical protein